MSKIKVYETLDAVIDAYPNWEVEQDAYTFGLHLWNTAETVIKSKKEIYDRDRLAGEVYLFLYETRVLTLCLTDSLRERVVRLGARGFSTTEIVKEILRNDVWESITPFYLFKYSNVCGYDNIKQFLVNRLGYLKRSHARFPVKKFGEVWQEERASYLSSLVDIPLASPQEQLQKLTDHYQKLEVLFDEVVDPKDKERYHKCMMRTMAAITVVGRESSSVPSSVVLRGGNSPKALPESSSERVLVLDVNSVDVVESG